MFLSTKRFTKIQKKGDFVEFDNFLDQNMNKYTHKKPKIKRRNEINNESTITHLIQKGEIFIYTPKCWDD